MRIEPLKLTTAGSKRAGGLRSSRGSFTSGRQLIADPLGGRLWATTTS